MATLIRDNNGRRCDGRCHNARLPRCRCICSGSNHGIARDQVEIDFDDGNERAREINREEVSDE